MPIYDMGDYLYITSDEPIEGISLDLGCPAPGSIITNITEPEDDYEELDPITIEFSL